MLRSIHAVSARGPTRSSALRLTDGQIAPEILPYDEELVEGMTEQLIKQVGLARLLGTLPRRSQPRTDPPRCQQSIIEEECEDASEKFAVGLYQVRSAKLRASSLCPGWV